MKLSDYVKLRRGAAAELAERLGVAQVLVYQWHTGRRPVPIERCAAIEAATQGVVRRRDLRPEDWRDIWPELATAAPAQEAA